MNNMTAEKDRYEFTEQVIGRTKHALEDGDITYLVNDGQVKLAGVLDEPIIPNVSDGTARIPAEHIQSDGTPIIALRPGESISLGDGFDKQSPFQRTQTIETIMKWGLESSQAEELVDTLSLDFWKIIQLSNLSLNPHAEAGMVAATLAFNLKEIKEDYNFTNAPSAMLGRIASRNLIVLRMEPITVDSPELVSHELAHFVERTHNPIKAINSQKSSDLRTLREELKAYQVGAWVYMHQHDIEAFTSNDIDLIISNSQLFVEYIRAKVNNGGLDPYLTTPQLVSDLTEAGLGLDRILHGRFDFDKMLTALIPDS